MHKNHGLFIYLNHERHTLTMSSQLFSTLGSPGHVSIALDEKNGIITIRAATKKIYNKNLLRVTRMGEGEQFRVSGTRFIYAGFPKRQRVHVELDNNLTHVVTERVYKGHVKLSEKSKKRRKQTK